MTPFHRVLLLLSLVCCYSLLFVGVESIPLAKPVRVIYTGEGCPCPAALSYKMNAPFVPLAPKYIGKEYNYRVEMPPPPTSQLNYRFDFTVEEPPPPKIHLQKKLNLYAKVDRIAMHKGDCPAAPAAPCSCGHYRYVNQLCNCNRPGCKCNSYSTTQMPSFNPYLETAHIGSSNAVTRRKRELHNVLFKKRPLRNDRPARFVKLYHKDLQAIPTNKFGIFGLKSLAPKLDQARPVEPLSIKTKRKVKKVNPLEMWLPTRRLMKRDIKGEYDLLEQERENIDLTVPEIIQYMPETLQPNFKRRQCYFGCGKLNTRNDDLSTANSGDANQSQASNAADDIDDKTRNRQRPQEEQHADFYEKNAITKKRELHKFAYQPVLTIHTIEPMTQSYKYLPDNMPLRNFLSTTSVPDPLGISGIPLKFAGDLESAQLVQSISVEPILGAQHNAGAHYPVEHISNEQLDRIISDIVYRHPSFIEATAHIGGDLVDPEPLQKQQTKDFLKKLFSGHLGLWNTDDISDFMPSAADDFLPFGYRSIGDIEIGNYQQPSSPSITSFLPVLY